MNFQFLNWFWKFATKTTYECLISKLIWPLWEEWKTKKSFAVNQGPQRWKIEFTYLPWDFAHTWSNSLFKHKLISVPFWVFWLISGHLEGFRDIQLLLYIREDCDHTKPPRDLIYDLKWTLGSSQEVLDITWTIGWLLDWI